MIPLYIVLPVAAGQVPAFPQTPVGNLVVRCVPAATYKAAKVFTHRADAMTYAEYEAQRNPQLMYYILTSEGVIQATAAPIQSKKFNENGELLPHE